MAESSTFTATPDQSITDLDQESTQETQLIDSMDAYKDDIIMARQEGFTIAQILSWLNEEGIKISRSKLY